MLDVVGMYLNISLANRLDKAPKYKIDNIFGMQWTIVVEVEGEGGREKIKCKKLLFFLLIRVMFDADKR